MNILLLGASGQDGRILLHLLANDQTLSVYPIYRTEPSLAAHQSSLPSRYTPISMGEISSASFLSIIDKCSIDIVVNLAGQSSVGKSFSCFEETFAANYFLPFNLSEALLLRPSVLLVHASSAYIFDCSTPIGPKSQIKALSPYAISKAKIYRHIISTEALRQRTVILHFFNHVSPYSDRRFLLPKIVDSFLVRPDSSPPRLCLCNLSHRRDWGLSSDYMEILSSIVSDPSRHAGKEYFVGSGLSMSVGEILTTVAELLSSSYSLAIEESLRGPADPPSVLIDPSVVDGQDIELPHYSPVDFIQKYLQQKSSGSSWLSDL